ncbi:DUF402 domain-containing protein [Paenibacillus sediminis]|uniref:RNA-binding protein associated with RNAse of E/G family n=1 Tax=Paenibacillus sediminis TaxID=664909 RepID=A0ABS4H039_9BACL|nr:DUF402 domain-containing protein [Paenibacillus sediminis]MBP1935884.1 putative RNA-binding protein associated with RNAse of E/G family [Paenibacillus sediminis]
MKRKFADRANWRRVTHRYFDAHYLNNEDFTGYLALYKIYDLKEPLWKTYGAHYLCIADVGYCWLQYFPKSANYVVTAIFDDKHRIVEWYIDICKRQGITDQGVPWFDDLYLDIVVLENRELFLLDEDELADALELGIITDHDFKLAWQCAESVISEIRNGTFPYFELSLKDHITWFQK